jgi:hypothetical protein
MINGSDVEALGGDFCVVGSEHCRDGCLAAQGEVEGGDCSYSASTDEENGCFLGHLWGCSEVTFTTDEMCDFIWSWSSGDYFPRHGDAFQLHFGSWPLE